MYKATLKELVEKERILSLHNIAKKLENLYTTIFDTHDKMTTILTTAERTNLIKDFRKNATVAGMDDNQIKTFYRNVDEKFPRNPMGTFPDYVGVVCDELKD
jgi:hypothetical protein